MLRGVTIKHAKSPRTGVKPDEIAVAKMPKARPQPHLEIKALISARRERVFEVDGSLEPARLSCRETALSVGAGGLRAVRRAHLY